MKNQHEIILYDNTDYSERYNQIRKEIYEQFVEEYEWDFVEEVPDDMIYAEMNHQDECDYQYFKDKFTQLLGAGYCLLYGTCGRWNGPARGGKFISSFDDLRSAIQHLDYLKIIDRNGHLHIEGYHPMARTATKSNYLQPKATNMPTATILHIPKNCMK